MTDRRIKAGLWFWGAFVAVGVVVLTLLAVYFLRNEFFLDLRGQRTSATVEKIVSSKTDVIHIAYKPAGTDATVRTTVQSLFGDDPRVGARIPIDYDPHDPGRAREAGNHDGLLLVPLLLGFGGFTLWNAFGRDGSGRNRRRSRRSR